MSCEMELEQQAKADHRAKTLSAPVVAQRVPTVTLVSHRELRGRHAAHQLQPGSLESRLSTRSHYSRGEGRSSSS